MAVRAGFATIRVSSKRVILLLLAVTLATSIALCALAWRLAVTDHAVQQQRAWERLEQAADSASSALLQQLARMGEHLRTINNQAPSARRSGLAELVGGGDGITALIVDDGVVKLFPTRRLRYLAQAPTGVGNAESAFTAGESLEYRGQDYTAAAQWFTHLANRSEGSLKAGALLRAARNEVKRKQPSLALADYGELTRLGPVSIDGDPAELVGRYARLALLGEPARAVDAASLLRDLEAARWDLSRRSYYFYREELTRICGVETSAPFWEESVSELVALLRQDRLESGERVVWITPTQPALLIWRSRADSVTALAVSGKYVAEHWLSSARGFAFGLETADRRTLIPLPASEKRSQRILTFANLHWRLVAAPAGPVADAWASRRMFVAGLALVIVLVLTGSCAVIRAVSRELAVARLQSDFVSAVSHEFRSPLTSLRSVAEMLECGRVPSEERKQRYYGLLTRETSRLHRLVEDLLDFGRMEAGVQRYQLRPAEATELVSQVVSEFREQNPGTRLEIELNAVASAPVLADAEALRRALRNLLDNAIKYSPGASSIQVDLRVEHGQVCIAVRDHGMGISKDDLKRVFRKFERGSAAKASSIRGTGLGLSMVHAIVRAHHGTIRVESQVNRGATFILSLPHRIAREERKA